MLNKLFRRSKQPAPTPELSSKGTGRFTALVAQKGDELLAVHEKLIENIYSFSQIDKARFDAAYRGLFRNVAQLVQLLPASERHHHSHQGGLLEHSLEVATFCARISGRFIYIEDGDEKVLARQALYVYAMISAGVLHDVGKALVDIDVVTLNGDKGTRWNPSMGPMKPGTRYIYQYNQNRIHGLHEAAGTIMLTQLIPPAALQWIWDQPKIRNQWLASISGRAMEMGGRVGECLIECDSLSTGIAMESMPAAIAAQADTMTTGGKPRLDTLLIQGIVKAFDDLPPNTPKNPFWVSQKFVACVTPRVIEVAKVALGVQGQHLPNKDQSSTLYDILGDHGMLYLAPGNRAVHQMAFGEGLKPLAVILFKREYLDPDNKLAVYPGKLICPSLPEGVQHLVGNESEIPTGTASTSGEKTKSRPAKAAQNKQTPPDTSASQAHETAATQPQVKPVPNSKTTPAEQNNAVDWSKPAPSKRKSQRPTVTPDPSAATAQGNSKVQAEQPRSNATGSPTNAPMPGDNVEETKQESVSYDLAPDFRSDEFKAFIQGTTKDEVRAPTLRKQIAVKFFEWVKYQILTGTWKINSLGSPVHLYNTDSLVMITPEIFTKFVDSGAVGHSIADKKAAVSQVQHAIQQNAKLRKGIVGSNMIPCSIEGRSKKARLHAMILTPEETHKLGVDLNGVEPNKALTVCEILL